MNKKVKLKKLFGSVENYYIDTYGKDWKNKLKNNKTNWQITIVTKSADMKNLFDLLKKKGKGTLEDQMLKIIADLYASVISLAISENAIRHDHHFDLASGALGYVENQEGEDVNHLIIQFLNNVLFSNFGFTEFMMSVFYLNKITYFVGCTFDDIHRLSEQINIEDISK